MSLMEEIKHFQVPRDSIAIWWLGQNGFIFKTPEGTTLATDLYLTDSAAERHQELGLDLHRQVPVLIEPEELEVDLYVTTHSHIDHADPETIRRLRHKDVMQFIGPHESCDIYRREGVEESRIVEVWPKREVEFRDIQLKTTFAMPTDATDLNHVGYVFRFSNGQKIYMTGDTDFTELLFAVADEKPDVVITVINGGFNNLSHWEAAELVSRIQPKIAIPCHYDMFPDNSINPLQFRAALRLKAPGVVYAQLQHGRLFLLKAT